MAIFISVYLICLVASILGVILPPYEIYKDATWEPLSGVGIKTWV